MDTRLWTLTLCALAACALQKSPDPPPPLPSGCSTDEGCAIDQICDEGTCVLGDRDGAFENASPIGLDEPIEGVIAPPGDIDRFAYTAAGPEWVRIQTRTNLEDGDNLDSVVRLYTEGGAEHAFIDNYPAGRINTYDSVLNAYLPTGGVWYISVEDITTYYTDSFEEEEWRGDETSTYELSVVPFNTVTSEPDSATAPSRTIDASTGDTIWAVGVRLEQPGDVDHIALDLGVSGAPLDIYGHASLPGSSARPDITLLDAAGTVVSHKPDLGEEGFLSLFQNSAQAYAIEATDVDGMGDDDAWFVLYARTYAPGTDHSFFDDAEFAHEVEPNETEAQATPAPADLTEPDGGTPYDTFWLEGALDAIGDVDVFRVSAEVDLNLSVRCWTETFGSLASVRARLLDDGGTDLTPTGQGDTETELSYQIYNAVAPTTGEYYVELSSLDDVVGTGAYYRCAVYETSFTVDPGA